MSIYIICIRGPFSLSPQRGGPLWGDVRGEERWLRQLESNQPIPGQNRAHCRCAIPQYGAGHGARTRMRPARQGLNPVCIPVPPIPQTVNKVARRLLAILSPLSQPAACVNPCYRFSARTPVGARDFLNRWCSRAGSNHRPLDYQSSALPSELREHILAPRGRLELPLGPRFVAWRSFQLSYRGIL